MDMTTTATLQDQRFLAEHPRGDNVSRELVDYNLYRRTRAGRGGAARRRGLGPR